MATVRGNVGVLGYVRALFRGAAVAGMGDAQLLERYRSADDGEAAGEAFAALVQRHGAMVLRACMAVARDRADAEDAFQATFLVLARRAPVLWVGDSLGPWLHAVAVRVATDARGGAARRRRHEQRYAERGPIQDSATPVDADLRAAVHEEVARLPEKHRAPVVLCDLQGLTHEQAAAQLGWPTGTLKTRLTGARQRLKGRLARRGLAPAAALTAASLTSETAAATLPIALSEATVRAGRAVRLAAGVAATGVVAASVESLVKGAIGSMRLTRIKSAATAVLAAVAVVGGGFACRGLFAGAPTPSGVDGLPPASGRPMEVSVVDRQTGRPVAGARLRATTYDPEAVVSEGTTDPAGRHQVKPNGGARALTLRVSAEGYVPVRVDWNSGRPRGSLDLPASYTVKLEKGTAIGGVVRDPEGQPVTAATVFVLVPPGPAKEPGVQPRVDLWEVPCVTDAQGRWRCETVPAELKAPWLRATHPDFVSRAVIDDNPAVLTALRDGSHVVRLERGVPVSGQVVDARGRPVAGAVVDKGTSLADFLHERVTTDDQGRFRFGHAPPGKAVLTVHAKGHAPDLREVEVQPGVAPLDFRLGPPATVRGRVVDRDGKPVAGAWVVTDTWREYRTLDVRTTTDADGRFTVTDLPDEPVEFQFAQDGYMNLPNQRLTPGTEAVLTLTRPLVIRGTVTDAKTGKPVDRFNLFEAYSDTQWDRDRPRPGRGGRYLYSANWPYPATRALRIEAPGYRPATSRPFSAGDGEVAYDFKLEPGVEPTRPAVEGVVLLPDGQPAADAEVVLAGKTFAPYVMNGKIASPRPLPIVRTGRDGAFRFAPQTEAVSLLVFHDRGFAEATEEGLSASPGHSLKLKEWGRVEGTLRVGPAPGSNQEVRLNPKRSEDTAERRATVFFDYQTRTDGEGHFAFERVVSGPASVSRSVSTSPNRNTFARWYPLAVSPGTTTQITVGGTGRAVVGRLVGPRDRKFGVDPSTLQSSLRLLPPPITDPIFHDRAVTGEQRRAWYEVWRTTAEGLAHAAWQKDPQFYGFAVQRDGTFRIEDVVPGDYELSVQVYEPNAGRGKPPAASARRAVTVGPIPGGRSDEPLDLGEVELVPPG